MTAIDVLARALYETSTAGARMIPKVWGALDMAEQEAWLGQAQVVAGRMLEAEPQDAPTRTVPHAGTPAERLTAVVTELVDAAERLDVEGKDGIPETDWQDAVRLLSSLRLCTDHIGTVVAGLTKHVYVEGEHGDVDVEGVGRVKIVRGRERRSWDGRGVMQAVIDAHMEQRGGEMPNDIWETAEWFLEVFPADRPRVTPLKALGIDYSEMCEDTPGRLTVQLPPR